MKGFLLYYTNIIPVSAIAFVSLLLAYKIYIKIRSKFKVQVNCWFCNRNTKVPYDLYNSWVCPDCEQYNGFTKDGDYNREILAQYACKYTEPDDAPGAYLRNSSPRNGLCDTCNENQRIKVEKLAQFEPENDSNFDQELGIYRKKLEEKYRLCVTCERHLNKILRDKKKMILGSKFASILSKQDLLKIYTKLKHLRTSNKIALKNITSITLLAFAFVNFLASANELTENTRRPHGEGDILANILFFTSSHLVAFTKVLSDYLQCIWNVKFIEKLYLYIKTVMLLIYYTIGYKVGSTPACIKYITIDYLPFGSIFLAFISNILDGFKISKNTFLLTVWSIYAGVTNSSALDEFYSMDSLKVITSAFVMLLSIPDFKESSRLLLDTTTNSFHRIYSEDYFTDTDSKNSSSGINDTILNTSSASNASVRSFDSKSIPLSPSNYAQKTSSVFNLNTSVMSAFKEYSSTDATLGSNHFVNLSQNNLNNSFTSNHSYMKPCSPLNIPEYTAAFNVTTAATPFHSNSRIIQNKVADNFYPSPLQSPFSYSNQSTCRQSLLSPARLSVKSSNNTMQSSWVSGGYFNKLNCADKRNYFFDSALVNETLSRASSQSSGFESQSSLNGDKNSRENSYCPETDIFSNLHENHNKFDTFNIPHRITENNPIDLLPRPESFCTNHHTNGLLSPALPQFSNHHPLSNALNYTTHQPTAKLSSTKSSMSPFDLNKMGDDLPHIQRGGLLRKWQEQNSQT